jgi:glycine cleavage system H protein
MKVKAGLLYSEDHEWIKVDGNIATIGSTDYAQHELGEIVFVDMPGEDDEFEAGEALGAIESVKAASDVLMPITGKIVEVNEDLDDEPGSVNETPYEAWIVKIEIADPSELDSLMDSNKYEEFTK